MGIQGLLPMLKEISNSIHIKECKGQTYAVDAYVWLHRGAYGCAEELALGKKTVKYVNYAMHRVRMLKYHGVTPLIVFDGGLLPSKMGTEGSREKRRIDALAKGNAFLAEGKKAQARDCFVKAVDITPEMAYQLIKALRREGIQYLVAPYEADPQLAYLERHGFVDGVITEDSDLLVFGCQNVLFKLDGDGNCVQIKRKNFSQCREFNFTGWSETEFRQMAILSGCDYIGSIVGLGLKTAYKLMKKYKTAERVIQAVRLEGQLKVPDKYFENFRKAELTFCHQLVFDPALKDIVHYQPLPDGLTSEELPFAGAPLEIEFARGLARGDIDPLSKLPMIDINPDSFSPSKLPYQPSTFKPTKSKSVIPAKGAGSLFNYFSKQPAAPLASTSKIQMISSKVIKFGATSTTTTTTTKKRNSDGNLIIVDNVKGKGKENIVAGGSIKSKFFGAAAATSKVKEKQPIEFLEIGDTDEEEEVIVVEDDDDDEVEVVEQEEEDEFPDDDDIPTQYYGSEWDEDALDHLREIELEFGELPLAPVHLVTQKFSTASGGGNNNNGNVSNSIDRQQREQQPPSSSIGISSPEITPQKRQKLTSSQLTERGDNNQVKKEGNIGGSYSTGAVTSPFNSDLVDEGEDEDEDDEEEGDQEMSSPSISKKITQIPLIKIEKIKEKVKQEKVVVVKGEKRLEVNKSKTLMLSSDPIELFSEPTEVEDEEEEEEEEILQGGTAREMKRRKKEQVKKGKGKEVESKPKIKIEKKPLIQQEVLAEDGDENLPTVAATWRERFLLSSSSSGEKSSRTGKVKSPLEKLTSSRSTVPVIKKSKLPTLIKAASRPSRIPLSPKKSIPNSKPNRSTSISPVRSRKRPTILSSPPGEIISSQGNKLTFKNKSLMQFAYKG